ncbi:threonylcarbamoyl-AMP synthase [Patescibacteria group bacterium]|nr:threonylcarbamoyl-AMP synthase [Patescibacteria group bacterium]MBU1500768.1 threonylcarbamoyl-AMP synthase [Patescibacteria group bacterium]MBU2080823.1 threonylcarbamoyl-AMP synthase [Patescibacteria group bacterium]MBU2123928.1 threonylcarbamoyl-AMP synthase [Patescibacteria group bacterium]MBU2194781.1 threonylcarbamoyl-AMP synthase [Patescibacteria group bacterium]
MEQLPYTKETQESLIQRAVETLSNGEILLYPTDTVYGLGVDATDEDAVAALRDLKGRDEKKPILIMVPSIDSIEEYAEMNEEAYRLAEEFLPGPLTLVLPAKKTVSYSVTFNRTIGIRIPDDPFCLALAEAFGKPITSTSANRAGMETRDTVPEILAQFAFHAESIGLVIDAGRKGKTQPSTIVSVTESGVSVLREGALSREVLGL